MPELLKPSTVDCLAAAYANSEPFVPDATLLAQFECEVAAWFARIPIPVVWCYDKQPFNSVGQMRRHCQSNGILLMYAAPSILGDCYHKHRAVHDWFGHIEPGIPFGVDGELASYRIHERMYSTVLHPLIFADVVLNNAYFEANGEFFHEEKYTRLDGSLLVCPANH